MFDNLDILVLVREVSDPRPPARAITRGAGIDERGLRHVPNPADLCALEEALKLKDALSAKVTVLAIGPERLDDTLRLAFSMGADRGIRFWDHGIEGGDALADARLFARIASILSPALIFTGNRLTDRGDDPVPALSAALSGAACIGAALTLTLKNEGVVVQRKSDRGGRQAVGAPLPCTVLFEEVATPRYPAVDAMIGSLSAKIERWELPDLSLPFWEVGPLGSQLPLARVGTPRPDPVRAVTPDPNLPAFDRILSLLSGGIAAREGKVQALSPDATVDALWELFRDEGLVPEAVA